MSVDNEDYEENPMHRINGGESMCKKLTTPVLLVIFNRPDTTEMVFSEIRKARPVKLFIAADGPRGNKPDDATRCQAARGIIKQVDWDCEVKTLFRDKNVGCKIGVSSAIEWFFENVEEGIILEDDCVPSQSFFWFCQELLDRYRDDTKIMHISGDNFQFGIKRGSASYYFSRYNLVSGWATWRRAWKHFDINMKSFEDFKRENQIINVFRSKKKQRYLMKIYEAVYDGKIVECWDYQWQFSRIIAGGIAIHPNVNLVRHIGYGPDATHTTGVDMRIMNNFAKELDFPLQHPRFILVNEDADDFIFRKVVHRCLLTKIESRVLRLLHDHDIHSFLFGK